MADNRNDSFVGIIHSYLHHDSRLKVEILSGEITIGMEAGTSGCTAECDMTGVIRGIYRSGDGNHERIERAVAGDMVYVGGLCAAEPKGMYRGAYLIPRDATPQKHKYMVVNVTKWPFQTLPDGTSQYIRLAQMSDIPGRISKRGQNFRSDMTVPAEGSVETEIECWHPWPQFDIHHHGTNRLIGKAYLMAYCGHKTKSAGKT